MRKSHSHASGFFACEAEIHESPAVTVTKMYRLFPRGDGYGGLLLEEKVARNVTDEV